ncbi:hypothetical protein [Paenibacillus sp. OV219]|uniref:beta-xylosidase family glycoside hydrolase n=1 Tax=Paenibacillus sp. OV219 TaxID=1884377 RepID=UPI000B849516
MFVVVFIDTSYLQPINLHRTVYGFEVVTKLVFDPKSRGEEAGLTLYSDSDAFVYFAIRDGLGQTARFLCFTASRVGIYDRGVYGHEEGSAL